jgi:hypothetical protein
VITDPHLKCHKRSAGKYTQYDIWNICMLFTDGEYIHVHGEANRQSPLGTADHAVYAFTDKRLERANQNIEILRRFHAITCRTRPESPRSHFNQDSSRRTIFCNTSDCILFKSKTKVLLKDHNDFSAGDKCVYHEIGYPIYSQPSLIYRKVHPKSIGGLCN